MKEQKERIGTIKISEFALRHFDSEFGGTKILNMDPKQFEVNLNSYKDIYFDHPEDRVIGKKGENERTRVNIIDGYAPFCKLLIMENITDAKTGTLPITDANYQFLRHGYSSRRSDELAVLSRWFDFPPGIKKPTAKYIVSVLYNKTQMDKEYRSEYDKKLSKGDTDSIGLECPEEFGADWGVVAILGTMLPKDDPMQPITMMRNYMDISMGGSGMKLPTPPQKPNLALQSELMQKYNQAFETYKREIKEFSDKYEISVKFWEQNAIVK